MRACRTGRRSATPKPTGGRELIDAVEGFYTALIIDGLHRIGVLRALSADGNVASIAKRLGIDGRMLSRLLAFIAPRANVVCATPGGRRGASRYTLAPSFELSTAEHLLDQYVGAYGPCLLALPEILRAPRRGERLVNRERHADAFTDGGPPPELVSMIETFDVCRLLDLGCGSAQLLATLARRRKNFRGTGIDTNIDMVRRARQSVAAGGLSRRVTIHHRSVHHLERVVSTRERRAIDAVCAVSVANGFFGSEARSIDGFLRNLQRLFPRRLLFLCDYYSRLEGVDQDAHGFKRTLVHDVAQLVSGQGLPPDSLATWQAIYKRTGVTLLQSCTRRDDGVAWFIHLIRL